MDHGRTHFGDEPARDADLHDETIAGEEDEVDRRRRLYAPGTTVGRYVLLQEVGAGAMGVVFAAFDPELNRKIALKILHPSRRAGAKAAAAARARLLREAQAIARVSHPHVISVYDVGTVHDAVFLAMEFVEGTTLTQWLEQPRSIPEVVDVFVQAARGLAAAHHAGLIHRDFKPDNVLVGFEAGGGKAPRPQVRVSDFGLARNDPSIVRDDDSEDFLEVVPRGSLSDSDILSSPLTQVGAVVGTPRYMAPEQHFGNDGDPRSDQFGFSVALYIALYKQDPFSAPSLERLALAKQQGRIRRIPSERRVPAFLEQAVMRGLSASMDQRFRSMDEMVEALLQDPDARRRRVLGWGGGLALVGAVAATIGYVQAQQGREQPCAGAEERLAGIWDDAQRERLRVAVIGTGVGYAEPVWLEVERQLDVYAVEWVGVHEEACEATHVRREQSDTLLDRRMNCLAGRRSALRALVEVLAASDATVVQRAVQSAGALPSLAACSNTEVLLAQVEPPADEATAGAVAVVRDQLADARALEGAGKYGEALEVARLAGETAEQLGYPPLVAEALSDIGSALESTGDYAGAEEHLMRAVWEAIRAGHDEAAARAATMLVGVVGDRLARHEEGLRWGEHARAVLDRLGMDPLAHARLDGALGNVLHRMNRQEEAREHFERAITIRTEAKGGDHPSLAPLHLNLGNVHYRQRRYDEAVASYERARDLATTRMGREHPLVGAGVASLGLVLMALEEYEDAEQSYEQALNIFRAAMGNEHPFVTNTISNLGVVLARLERHEEAREKYEEALTLYRASVGDRHPDTARMLHNIGNVHQEAGELDEARRYYEQALEIRRESLPAHHPELGHSHEGLAELDKLSGHLSAAVQGYTRALEIYEGGETDAITRARARFELAQVLWEQGEHEPARVAGRTARDGIEADDTVARKLRDEIEAWLAGLEQSSSAP